MLLNELSQNNKEYLNVNIYFHNKNNINELALKLDKNHSDFNTRVKKVIELQKNNAGHSHEVFINSISRMDYDKKEILKNINHYWVLNMINADVKTEYIYELLNFDEIAHIDLNSPRYRVHEVQKTEVDGQKSVNSSEPGLKAINAHKLWELGYTGRNILFLSVDTGVLPQHPAISNNFAGNYLPMSQCWYGIRHEYPTDNDLSSSHGTHTTGTVLGLDPSNNDTIGVAFNARWIATDPVASRESELLTPAQLLSVFEWALNPDGDDNTTNDVPRVINNSWGFDYQLAAQFNACDIQEAQILVIIETAGICSPFSAGNEGSGESTIGFPAMLAYNEINPMSIGALNANLTIANFSSRGPSTCIDEDGILKIKPEVCAPGVNIRSCSKTNGYAYLSGTSMSCPHVSGALILLAEAFPDASAYELKNALYLTAIDLGEEGEDNTFGRGIIDVYAAYEFLCNTYTPTAPVTNQYDLKTEIIVPENIITCTDNNNLSVKIRIINEGISPVENFNFKVYINNELISDQFQELILNSGEYFEYSIDNYNSEQTYNTIYATVAAEENIQEFDIFNNGVVYNFYLINDGTYPLNENFENFENIENITPALGWVILNPDYSNTWEILKWGENDEHKSIGINFKEYISNNNEKDYIYIPKILLPEDDSIFFNFTYAYKNDNPYGEKDSLIIELSTDCGNTFQHSLFAQGHKYLATVPGQSFPLYKPVSFDEFDTISIPLTEFKGQEILMRLTAVNNKGSVIYIDQTTIGKRFSESGIFNYSNNYGDLKIFPNPAKDIIKVEIPDNINSDILEIYNSTGQSILKIPVKNGIQTIDCNSFNPGTYFIKLMHSGLRTKFIKK
jgi:hypothetical protein